VVDADPAPARRHGEVHRLAAALVLRLELGAPFGQQRFGPELELVDLAAESLALVQGSWGTS